MKYTALIAMAVVSLSTSVGYVHAATAQHTDRETISRDDLLDGHFDNVYDGLEALRPNWLRERGPLTFDKTRPVVVLVYIDNMKLGTVDNLKSVASRYIATVSHLDGVQATARYGLGHGAGVIEVSTWGSTSSLRDTVYETRSNIVIEGDGHARADGFPLTQGGRSAMIYVSEADLPGVARAARDFGVDVGRVTGIPSLVTTDSSRLGRSVVIAGTIGKDPVIDRLVKAGKINVTGVSGKWESYVRQMVTNPMPGVDQALVIAGSDRRGTIYGLYDLSSLIGVSPWYWWADVPVAKHNEIFVTPNRFVQGEPAVKYRGIFINDEAPAFSGWAREKFGGVNHELYEHMFELILRMKGNYLWPAMWNNAFADDDSLNAIRANEYGIVMGTSHHEPLTRAQKEWTRYGKGPWDYGLNDTTLRAFWRKGIERMWNGGAPRENIVTIGMRGDGDRPMTTNGESNVGLLEKIVADQRKIISDVTGKTASETPSMWALYKEVQDYYDKGMRVPDDVTLLFSDDNWGNIRRLPSAADRNRAGGFGIYYHFDYVGGPRNYKWINTNPIARVWEQMHLANELGANRIWVVNVGDLKPMEFPIQFFLDYAFNPQRWPAERLPEYTQQWAAQQFGAAHASEIADIVTRYLTYAGRRKPELLAPETYSLSNYREAENVLAEYHALMRDVAKVARDLAPDQKDAFYELVQHPVEAAANLNDLYITVAKNHVYANQQRASTNDLADRARALFERDAEISKFYNTQVANGKWPHMMDQTHIGYTIWQEPPRNLMPRVDVLQVPIPAEMGVAYEGQSFERPVFVPGQRPVFRAPALPMFDAYQKQSYYLEIYNKGQTPFDYTVEPAQPWVLISAPKGRVEKDARVFVSIDWAKAPAGNSTVPVTVSSSAGNKFTVQAVIRNPATPRAADVTGFVESEGYVAMEAEHYTRAVTTPLIKWMTIPDLGRTLSGVEAAPLTVASQSPGAPASPHLEYDVFMFDSGTVNIRAFLSPTLNFTGSTTGLRYAMSIDDEAPQMVSVNADEKTLKTWEQWVSDNIIVQSTRHTITSAGKHVVKFWLVDPGVVLQRIVLDAGGMKPSYLGPPESFFGTGKTNVSRKDEK